MSTSTGNQDEMTAEALKSAAKKFGADLAGIASIDRFDHVPKEKDPKQIFPETRSVIVLGRRIPRGALRGVEEGTQFSLYNMYGYDWLDNRFNAIVTYNVAEYLEDNGYEAVPLPNLPPQIPPMGIPVADDKPAPNVLLDFDDLAVRAGLGEIDYGRLFISPEFGPRQRFQVVLTDAELEPDPLLTEPISDCTGSTYAAFCPLGAIDPDREEVLEVCGKSMTVASVDYSRCRECKNGAVPNRYHPAAHPDRLAALCVRSCLNYLEKNGRIKNTFANLFRRRPAWQIVDGRTYLEKGSDIE